MPRKYPAFDGFDRARDRVFNEIVNESKDYDIVYKQHLLKADLDFKRENSKDEDASKLLVLAIACRFGLFQTEVDHEKAFYIANFLLEKNLLARKPKEQEQLTALVDFYNSNFFELPETYKYELTTFPVERTMRTQSNASALGKLQKEETGRKGSLSSRFLGSLSKAASKMLGKESAMRSEVSSAAEAADVREVEEMFDPSALPTGRNRPSLAGVFPEAQAVASKSVASAANSEYAFPDDALTEAQREEAKRIQEADERGLYALPQPSSYSPPTSRRHPSHSQRLGLTEEQMRAQGGVTISKKEEEELYAVVKTKAEREKEIAQEDVYGEVTGRESGEDSPPPVLRHIKPPEARRDLKPQGAEPMSPPKTQDTPDA